MQGSFRYEPAIFSVVPFPFQVTTSLSLTLSPSLIPFRLFLSLSPAQLGVKEEQEAVVRRELQKRELILKDKV